MAYLVHHTLNRNETYTDGKRNTLPIHGKRLTDKSQYKKKSETNKSTSFSIRNLWTDGRKCAFECPIHRIINSGKIEGAYFDWVRSIF